MASSRAAAVAQRIAGLVRRPAPKGRLLGMNLGTAQGPIQSGVSLAYLRGQSRGMTTTAAPKARAPRVKKAMRQAAGPVTDVDQVVDAVFSPSVVVAASSAVAAAAAPPAAAAVVVAAVADGPAKRKRTTKKGSAASAAGVGEGEAVAAALAGVEHRGADAGAGKWDWPGAGDGEGTAAEVQAALQVDADAAKGQFMQGFFKTMRGGYGEGDVFAGLTVPQVRVVAKTFATLPLRELDTLLQSALHEDRLTALIILVAKFEKADKAAEKASKKPAGAAKKPRGRAQLLLTRR